MTSIANAAVKRLRLHKRQNGVCPICGMGVSLRESGAMAATLDHIVPKSRGGSGAIHNLRVVHRICNTMRGNDCSDVIIEFGGIKALRWNAVVG